MTNWGNTSDFHTERRAWFAGVARDLARLLRELAPEIDSAIPDDLGPRDLVAATVIARVAQADMERQEIADVAGDLVRLAGAHGHHAPERVSEVEALWLALREPTLPLLNAWWREPAGEGLLAHWAWTRAEEAGWSRIHRELRERWSLDSDDIWRRGLMAPATPDHDAFEGFLAFLEARTDGREADFARTMLANWDGLDEEIEAYADECAAELGAVPHLLLVHRERVLAESLATVMEGNLANGRGDFPPDLRTAAEAILHLGREYGRHLAEEFIPGLTPLERAHLDLGSAEDARCESFLRAFTDIWCAPGHPALSTAVFTEEDFAPLKPAERPRAIVPEWMGRIAEARSGSGQLGWTVTVGSQPWWLYTAEAGLESAAAMRFKQDGRVRIGHRTLEDPHDLLVGFPPEDPDANNLIMRFRYDEDDAHQLCELLVLARTGRAQLGFLVRDASGAYRMLRMVSVVLPPQLRTAMRAKALAGLNAMTDGDPNILARLIVLDPEPRPPGPVRGRSAEPEPEQEPLFDDGLFVPPGALF
ncbi:hypothetical protein [Streptomyces sp. CAU 1734]|uniref:hypothetical protein n=1 Tax=Streptomyces sp. CAU 1734 TaxID=3140360 RepID=UPI00326007F4